jgi:hypothetical protein
MISFGEGKFKGVLNGKGKIGGRYYNEVVLVNNRCG